MSISLERANDELKKIERGLFIEVASNSHGKYYKIRHKDDRTGLVRDIHSVLDDEGKPTSLSMGDIKQVLHGVDWDKMRKYQDPQKMADAIIKEFNYKKTKQNLERQGLLLDMRKEFINPTKLMEEVWSSMTPRERFLAKEAEKKRRENKKIIV